MSYGASAADILSGSSMRAMRRASRWPTPDMKIGLAEKPPGRERVHLITRVCTRKESNLQPTD